MGSNFLSRYWNKMRALLVLLGATRAPIARLRFLFTVAFPFCGPVQAAIQFDVFVGYDGIVREAGWFPVACEVHNDGPSFKAIFEIAPANFGSEHARQFAVELPSNTRKRFVLPMFSSGGRFGQQWEAKLMDERGKVRAERSGLSTKPLSWEGILLGAVPRNFGGLPTLPETRIPQAEMKPQVARLQLEQFPDNPIALESLDALYLNSEKAIELKVPQVMALLAWVRGGGHLIVAIEQGPDVTGTPWLQQFLPFNVTGAVNAPIEDPVALWVRSPAGAAEKPLPRRAGGRVSSGNSYLNVPIEPGGAPSPIATGTVHDGKAIIVAGDHPLAIEANRGRGKVTVLTFSPEREPFRSWKTRSFFWAKLINVPGEWFTSADYAAPGGYSIDGVFGALIDSRQIKKLPVEWLLLLLVVYLIVIGPLDQYWLKKINRQMLTWITFPLYVVFFSLLIYFIGYKLRAGETEWNELQIVDILPRGDQADLRGRTYASVYSSGNAKYQLASEQPFATLRGEFMDLLGGGGNTGSKAKVLQTGTGFHAEITVPVWTSLLYASDWVQAGPHPLAASVEPSGEGWALKIENFLEEPLTEIRLVVGGLIFDVGGLSPHEQKTMKLDRAKGASLKNFVQQHGASYQAVVERRRNPLGDDMSGRLDNGALTASVTSFHTQLSENRNDYRNFVAPPGLDLTPLVQRGDAVILAWDAGHSLAAPINKFQPPRVKRNTMLRLVVPVKKSA